MITLGAINGWHPPNGRVTTWFASPAACEAARRARRSDLAPTYQRTGHLLTAYYAKKIDKQVPRLMIVAWDLPGKCEISAMTAAINCHVRRHDVYHDWFEFQDNVFVRRMIDDPEDIDFVPVEFGYMSADEIRTHALTKTPATLEWDCFTFGIIQHGDYFTFYASVDHLHIDGVSAFLILIDTYQTYVGLQRTEPQHQSTKIPEIASYRDYAARQRKQVSSLTLLSPQIQDWINFARGADGSWPSFPLPLGDTRADSDGDFLTVDLLDATQTECFDAACRAAGIRLIGGVLACAALAEHALTGRGLYHGFTSYDTRLQGVDTTTVGWFARLIPVTVPTGTGSFPEAARAAQHSFDAAKRLAGVPFERVLELATPDQLGITLPTRPAMMVSFYDFRKVQVAAALEAMNFGIYGDNLSHGGVNVWINRLDRKTTLTISFPDNPIARESVRRYSSTLLETFAAAAEVKSSRDGHLTPQRGLYPGHRSTLMRVGAE